MSGLEKFLLIGVLSFSGLGFAAAPHGWGLFGGARDVYKEARARHKKAHYYSTRTGSRHHRTYHTGGKH